MSYQAHDSPNLGAEMVNFPGVFVPDHLPDDVLTADQLLARRRRDELVERQYGKPKPPAKVKKQK